VDTPSLPPSPYLNAHLDAKLAQRASRRFRQCRRYPSGSAFATSGQTFRRNSSPGRGRGRGSAPGPGLFSEREAQCQLDGVSCERAGKGDNFPPSDIARQGDNPRPPPRDRSA